MEFEPNQPEPSLPGDPEPERGPEYRYPTPEEYFSALPLRAPEPDGGEPAPADARGISVRLTRRETIAGLIFLPFYLFLLALIISLVCVALGCGDLSVMNLLHYAICFALTCVIFFRFLRGNIRIFAAAPGKVLTQTVIHLLLNYACTTVLGMIAAAFPEVAVNENNAALLDTFSGRSGGLILLALLLAPVVEECLFRGLVFSTLLPRSRVLAYSATVLVFSAIHIVPYLADLTFPIVCFNLLQYGSAAFLLCRCYEKADCIFASILLHMSINLIACLVLLAGL